MIENTVCNYADDTTIHSCDMSLTTYRHRLGSIQLYETQPRQMPYLD